MDNVNYSPRMLPLVVERRLLAGDPFMLIDVGCGLGIDPLWRLFGDDLQAHGFEPREAECDRLRRQEANPNVHYHAAMVGFPPAHPFHQAGAATPSPAPAYFSHRDQLHRSSTYAAILRQRARQPAAPLSPVAATEQWRTQPLSPLTVAIDDFAAERGIASVDFVKIDTDGRDLEAATTCAGLVRDAGILGFMIECFFNGSQDPTEASFHNVDGFMRRQGFLLYGISAYRYSRAALPAPFLYPAFYQTVAGQPRWGDMIYLRDGASRDYRAVWGGELSETKLLKLACLYELFQVPDCAAELILVHRDRLRPLIDPAILLDRLTPPVDGVQRSYTEYVKLFEERPEAFFPPS
jgi:hypothetical protein